MVLVTDVVTDPPIINEPKVFIVKFPVVVVKVLAVAVPFPITSELVVPSSLTVTALALTVTLSKVIVLPPPIKKIEPAAGVQAQLPPPWPPVDQVLFADQFVLPCDVLL
jgi:hypothetical protein